MQVSAKFFACALLPIILASLVAVTLSQDEITDEHLIQFMSSFTHTKLIVPDVTINDGNPMPQHFNHLNHTDYELWYQYYHACDEFAEDGKGPIILVIVGASQLTELDKRHPVWIEFAQRTNGQLYFLEQRFYGENYPSDYFTEDFKDFFNSDEALNDISNFISFIKDGDFPDNKWIVVGEGHGGKLAAWTRMKFPHLVDGAVVVNAPLRPKLEDDDYFNIISSALSVYSNILNTMNEAYETVTSHIKNRKFDDLKNDLKLCTSPAVGNLTKNIQYMYWSVTWNLGLITKIEDTDKKLYKTDILNTFVDYSQTPIQRLKTVLEIILNRYQTSCIHVDYNDAVKKLKISDYDAQLHLPKTLRAGLGNRQFLWQSCIDFGYMKTSTKENMFGDVPLTFFIGLCKEVFGDWYNENILKESIGITEMFYNGANIDVTKTLFINFDDETDKLFTVHKNENNRDIEIVNVPEMPVNALDLTNNEREDLQSMYKKIFQYIQDRTGLSKLQPPNVVARKVSEFEEGEDIQIIHSISSFTNAKRIVPYTRVLYYDFEQVYDHIGTENAGIKWNQRYHENIQFQNNNGPIILVVGALSAFTDYDFRHPIWTEFVQRSQGVLYFLDHRYYSKVQPTDHTTENYVKYLNSDQALGDIVEIVKHFKTKFPESKVIVVGESYGGNLAARMIYKFPRIVDGAVVVNAPLIPKVEFKEYFDLVNKHLSQYQNVMETIKAAYEAISEDIDNLTYANLQNKFNLCSDLSIGDGKKNIEYMLWSITWNLGTIMELKDTDQYKIEILTAFADTSQSDPVVRLKEVLEILLRRSGLKCIHVKYKEAVEWLKNTDLKKTEHEMDKTLRLGIGKRPKFWEICTEYGHMKTSTKDNMFGDVKLEFFTDLCKEAFGTWYDKTNLEDFVETTSNKFYAMDDFNPNNILFINFNNIYEKALTITKEVNRNINIINIPDFPATPDTLTLDTRNSLIQTYHEIYDNIQIMSDVIYLQLPYVISVPVPDIPYKTKETDVGETSANPSADSKATSDSYEGKEEKNES